MVHPASLKTVLELFTRDIAAVCSIDHPPLGTAEARKEGYSCNSMSHICVSAACYMMNFTIYFQSLQ